MIINKKSISKPLLVMGGIVKPNSIIPILSNIYVEYKENILRLRASDAETQIEYKFKCEGDEEFAFCAPGHLFTQTILRLNTEDIKLTYKERDNGSKYITIKSGKGTFKIEVIAPKDFIYMDVKSENEFDVAGEEFLRNIKRSLLACDAKDMRASMNGVGIISTENEIQITGSCPHTITKQVIASDNSMEDFLLSNAASVFISNLGFKGMVNVFNHNGWFGLSAEGFKVQTKLVDARPNELNQFWNAIPDKEITVNNLELQSAIKRVSSYATDEYSLIKISIENDKMDVIGDTKEMGHYAEEEVSITNSNVENIVIGVNANYILSALGCIDAEHVNMMISENNKPVYIQALGNEKDVQTWLVMPIKID